METRFPELPELPVANRFSIFQVRESSGARESSSVAGVKVLDPPSNASVPPPINGVKQNYDGKLISSDIVPIPKATEVDCTWGSSSKWVLELWDGRRFSIPLSLLRLQVVSDSMPTVGLNVGQLVTREAPVGVGSTADDLTSLCGSEYSGDDDEAEDNISLVWEDPETHGVGSELVCWGDKIGTLDVEPLAISKPMENELRAEDLSTPGSVVEVSLFGVEVSPSGVEDRPFDWVLRKSKLIGKVLGANYNGNEERINRLLMEIDGRRP